MSSKFFLTILLSILLSVSITILSPSAAPNNDVYPETQYDCTSAILMEAETGAILYEQNSDKALPPASVTKIMTLLLTMEAIDNGTLRLEDILTCSSNASSMGGSQVYLEEGEQISVEELIKCVVICSANDAAVMLAEAIAGSEEAFVVKMNTRAKELNMVNTVFENTNGLDDTTENHVTSARDIAIMSRELIKHDKILEYSSIWMDSIRNGTFGLTNTNRLVRFYPGATGLKTGSTSKAKFCISATAKRGNMHLICVVMGAETRDMRNSIATKLLDWGFATYALYIDEGKPVDCITVRGGAQNFIDAKTQRFCCVINKGQENKITREISINETLSAPIANGDKVGTVKYTCEGQMLGESNILTVGSVDKIKFLHVLSRIFSSFII